MAIGIGSSFHDDCCESCKESAAWAGAFDRVREDEIIREIIHAIQNEGANPEHHRAVLKRHVAEWPTLWRALYKLLQHKK